MPVHFTSVPQRLDVMAGSRSSREQLEQILLRSRTFSDRRCFNITIRPLPCRRTASAVSEFVPLTPFRSRSSRPRADLPSSSAQPVIMQNQRPTQNNVSVARFFDWSEQDKDEHLSVSRLYREMAVGVGASVPRSLSEKVRAREGAAGCAGGAVSPGRMFLRDKGMLTKGEREIIEGIYRNRGDLRRKDHAYASRPDFFVRSHHDAWLVGKEGAPGNKPSTELPRDPPRSALMEIMAPAAHSTEYSSSRASDITHSDIQGQNRTTCAVCLKEQLLLQQQQQKQQQHHHAAQKAFKKKQPPALPADSVLRPMNVYDGFRYRGGVGLGQAPPMAPPASPIFGTSAVSPERRNHNNGLNPALNDSSTRLLPRRRHDVPLTSRYEPEHLTQFTASRHEPVHRTKFTSSLQENSNSGANASEHHNVNPSGGLDAGDKDSEPCSDGESSNDSEGSRRKVQVKVYLPIVAAEPTDEDMRSCMLQGRPALARERPLSHSDIKHEQNEGDSSKEGGAQEREGEVEAHQYDRREDVVADSQDRHGRTQREAPYVREDVQEQKGEGHQKLLFHDKHGIAIEKNVNRKVQRGSNSARQKEDAVSLSSGESDGERSNDTPRKHGLRTLTLLRADVADCRTLDE